MLVWLWRLLVRRILLVNNHWGLESFRLFFFSNEPDESSHQQAEIDHFQNQTPTPRFDVREKI